jgi:type II secretory pathway pseudopilin PulG
MKITYPIAIIALSLTISLPSALAQSFDSVSNKQTSSRKELSLTQRQLQLQYNQSSTSQPYSNLNDYSTPRLLELPKFPFRGAPSGRRRGGTSRNGCPISSKPLTALVPGEETSDKSSKSVSFLAQTVTEKPTFWVYVPNSSAKERSGEFVMQNETGKEIYRTSLTLPKQAGTIGLRLPNDPKYALQTNKNYHWYFKLFCDGEGSVAQNSQKENYVYVDASIERVALTDRLGNQTQKIASKNYVTYANNNLWYDAIAHLANLRLAKPQEQIFRQDWAKLLTVSGLSDLVEEPIVKIYQLPKAEDRRHEVSKSKV